MAWTAKIAEKKFSEGILTVNVAYSNEAQAFNEVLRFQDGAGLDSSIRRRLKQLEDTEAIEASLTLGEFTPKEEEGVVTEEPKSQIALRKLIELKSLADLGLIETTSSEYLAAKQEARAELEI